MEDSKFKQILPALTQLILSNGTLALAAAECIKNFGEFIESTGLIGYQRLGYPLGKSWRGFKKWQMREMRKGNYDRQTNRYNR